MSRRRTHREREPEAGPEPSASHHYGSNAHSNPFTHPWPSSGAVPSHMPYYPVPYMYQMQQFPSAMPQYPPPPPIYPAAIPRQHADPVTSREMPRSDNPRRSAAKYEDRGRSRDYYYEDRYGNNMTSARGSSTRSYYDRDPLEGYEHSESGEPGRQREQVVLVRNLDHREEAEELSTTSRSQEASLRDSQNPSQTEGSDVLYSASVFGYSRSHRDSQRPLTITRNRPIEFQMKRSSERESQSRGGRQSQVEQPIFHVAKFLASSKQVSSMRKYGVPTVPNRPPVDGTNPEELSRTTADAPISVDADAGTIITIRSDHLIKAIDRLVGSFPGMTRSGDSLIVPEPFCVLLHHRDLLLGQAERNDDQSAVLGTQKDVNGLQSNLDPEHQRDAGIEGIHLRKLYDYLDQDYLEPIRREKTRWKERRTCTFHWLWLLFPPKTLVYEGRSDALTMRAFQVSTFSINGLFVYDGGPRPKVHPQRLYPIEHGESPIESITINIKFFRHDGREWESRTKNVTIMPFVGEKLIADLPVFPASFLNDPAGALRQELIDRGRRYQSLGTRGQVEYHGDSLSGVRRRIDGKVVVDPETYQFEPHLIKQVSHNPKKTASGRNNRGRVYGSERDLGVGSPRSESAVGRGRSGISIIPTDRLHSTDSRLARIGADSSSEEGSEGGEGTPEFRLRARGTHSLHDLEEEEYMICSPDIMGYILKEREWVRLAVGSISDCVYEERMIDDLQITQEARNLVQALSHNFTIPPKSSQRQVNGEMRTQGPWSADFVPGKGGGRIILLHGKPGVGKTSTAECVAELTKRPLLTITCGDLGTDAMSVDQELTRWLRLGTLWNAVLLFDEADVFLEARAHGDIDRNSLVSVFLRALEYYEGLMFLTTNRIGSFDEAIISRIHVVLHLPDLTDMDRERIWNTSFRKLEKERADISADYALVNYAYHDDEIRKLNWNGREIRNAFNTMIALAEWDAQQHGRYAKDGKVEVRREHLQDVARMSSAFKLYLKSLRAMEHEEYTKSLGLRDDRFRVGATR